MTENTLNLKNDFKQLPEEEMPREKLVKYGASALTNSELIAILLRTGSSNGNSVLHVAMQILVNADHSLEKLFNFRIKDLTKIKGIGFAKAITLFAAFELSHRFAEEQKEELKEKFTNPENVFRYFQNRLSLLNVEEFRIIMLNNANRFIKDYLVTKGILNASVVHPREVFREAISENAASLILIHNHPSGESNPSNEDLKITKQLESAGKIIDISVLDHIIISKNSYFSFKENNLL